MTQSRSSEKRVILFYLGVSQLFFSKVNLVSILSLQVVVYSKTYIHTYTIHIYIYTYIHIHTYIYVLTHTYKHIHICIHIHTYIYTYTHIYIHIYTYTYIHIHIHTHTYTHTHIYTYTTCLWGIVHFKFVSNSLKHYIKIGWPDIIYNK